LHMITLDDTFTLGRTPVDEELVHPRDLYLAIHNIRKRQTSIPQVEFEPAIPASRAVIGIGLQKILT